MKKQLDIFRDSRVLHRNGDPATSVSAAREVSRSMGRQCSLALQLVREHPGSTASELDALNRTPAGSIRKRLNDLRATGHVEDGVPRKCSITGRVAQTWWAIDIDP